MRASRAGFTLIELLIVVAIISILAAIAIPNFLEAQIRAKVARVQAEYKTIQTAMLAYRVDENSWPAYRWDRSNNRQDFSVLYHLQVLTTPVSYLTTVPFQDPFSTVKNWSDPWGNPVGAHYQYWRDFMGATEHPKRLGDIRMTRWVVANPGPTQDWPPNFAWYIAYDSSNGTVSPGTLWVSEMGIFGDQ